MVGRALFPPELLGGGVVDLVVVEGHRTLRVVGDRVLDESVSRGVDAAVDVFGVAETADPAAALAPWVVLWVSHGQ